MEKRTRPEIGKKKSKIKKNIFIEDLLTVIPQELAFFDFVKVEKKFLLGNLSLKRSQLEKFFEHSFTVLFDIKGEFRSLCLAQMPNITFQKLAASIDNFSDLFIEVNNTILGQYLTNIDESFGVLSQYQAPYTLSTLGQQPSDKAKQGRILDLVSKGLEHSRPFKIGYD